MVARFWQFIVSTLASRMLFRRLVLMWAMGLTTIVVLRVTVPEVLGSATAGGASIAVASIGILATVVGLYQWLRQMDDHR